MYKLLVLAVLAGVSAAFFQNGHLLKSRHRPGAGGYGGLPNPIDLDQEFDHLNCKAARAMLSKVVGTYRSVSRFMDGHNNAYLNSFPNYLHYAWNPKRDVSLDRKIGMVPCENVRSMLSKVMDNLGIVSRWVDSETYIYYDDGKNNVGMRVSVPSQPFPYGKK